MLRGGPGPSTNGAGTARRQRESKQCVSEEREQLQRRVQKSEAKTSRDNSSEQDVVMVLNKLWAGRGRKKRLAAQRLGARRTMFSESLVIRKWNWTACKKLWPSGLWCQSCVAVGDDRQAKS